ncbi:MAG: hypothetical protein Q8P57_05425 [Candidatus Pacearchaeota archaeon]|nr:hypothetical protein [Candidatus Pacearchaeota archaeon]
MAGDLQYVGSSGRVIASLEMAFENVIESSARYHALLNNLVGDGFPSYYITSLNLAVSSLVSLRHIPDFLIGGARGLVYDVTGAFRKRIYAFLMGGREHSLNGVGASEFLRARNARSIAERAGWPAILARRIEPDSELERRMMERLENYFIFTDNPREFLEGIVEWGNGGQGG